MIATVGDDMDEADEMALGGARRDPTEAVGTDSIPPARGGVTSVRFDELHHLDVGQRSTPLIRDLAHASFFARDGCTRFGSPGIFGKFGGYGASPSPCASSRSTHSSRTRRSHTASSMPLCRSPSSAKRAGIVAIVKSSISTSGSSSHRTGADTVASGRPRTEYAERIVRSRAFWL